VPAELRLVARVVGRLDHLARRVELPAVIDAAQAAFLVARQGQRCLAVRAALVDDAHAAVRRAKGDEVDAQQAHAERPPPGLELAGRDGGQPVVLPDHLAHRRAVLDAGQQVVVFA
jgi:hypothetical protein